jgi:membrane protein implicated in regulation of membrane protease activity
MLTLYLAALVVGGALLGFSLLGGHGHDVGHDVDHGGGHEGSAIAAALASVRFWTYLLAFGGACGVLLRTLAHTPEPLGGLLSLGAGAGAGLLAQTLIARATSGGDVGTLSERDLVGRLAQVLVPFAKPQTGKVRVQLRDNLVDVLAVTDEEGELDAKQEVVILEMRDGCALVSRSAAKE